MAMDAAACGLRDAKHVVVFTGAGASAESGIPTFRDALTGLWERFDPPQLATTQAYRSDPCLCWGWYEWRRRKVDLAQPNDAHRAIAELVRHVPKLTVITQNVDNLHERAGSSAVIHLHGSLHSPRCIDCGLLYTSALPTGALPESGVRVEPPRCSTCDSYVRPGVVWFGEMLPEEAWREALEAVEDCDFFCRSGLQESFTLQQNCRFAPWVAAHASSMSTRCALRSAVRSTSWRGLHRKCCQPSSTVRSQMRDLDPVFFPTDDGHQMLPGCSICPQTVAQLRPRFNTTRLAEPRSSPARSAKRTIPRSACW